jgi:hypothetical protein
MPREKREDEALMLILVIVMGSVGRLTRDRE